MLMPVIYFPLSMRAQQIRVILKLLFIDKGNHHSNTLLLQDMISVLKFCAVPYYAEFSVLISVCIRGIPSLGSFHVDRIFGSLCPDTFNWQQYERYQQ